MTVERVVLRPYALPLKQVWRGARAALSERRGVLVGVFADGIWGWGDCAPLPSSGEAGHARAFAALKQAADGFLRGASVDADLASIDNAQARWAVETALLDLSSRRRGLPLHQVLGGTPVRRVSVNAAAGALDESDAVLTTSRPMPQPLTPRPLPASGEREPGAAFSGCAGRVARAVAEGFGIVKIKVGVGDWREEARRLRVLNGLGARFRLDANRAWGAEEALGFLDAVADLSIDGVEEPLAQPTLENLRRLQERYAFAIAVDESLFELGPEMLFAARAVRRLVMKPARIGGFRETLRLAERAADAGMEVVITSVVDSAIGVAAAAQLAAALDPMRAHGLATSSWLARDVAAPLVVRDGALVLPDAPGLGLQPHP